MTTCFCWFARQRWRAWIETDWCSMKYTSAPGFARQRWRAWIETTCARSQDSVRTGSPVSDGGRGLKPHQWAGSGRPRRFARQRWRAWIETAALQPQPRHRPGSPVSDGGRGLKHCFELIGWAQRSAGSPVSDGGRGLKPSGDPRSQGRREVRPSAMAGVD